MTGTCCFLHSPPFRRHSLFPSQCSFPPPFSISKPSRRRNTIRSIACVEREIIPTERDFRARRLIVLMGFAVIPLINTTGEAIEAYISGIIDVRALDKNEKAKGSSSENPFFPLLNAFGFLGTGVLAALYASMMKEKADADATIESLNIRLKDKEATITSLEKRIEAELLNEKEIREKALAKANEEQQSLVNQLKPAIDTIEDVIQELQKEVRVVEQLTARVDDLEVSLHAAEDEKTELQNQLKEKLNSVAVLQGRVNLLHSEIKDKEETLCLRDSKLADKERELNQLRRLYQQLEAPLMILNTDIKELKDLHLINEKERELKNEMIHKLKAELTFSRLEKNESSKKLDAVLEEYNKFKSSTEEKSISNATLLGETEVKIHQLEEQLKLSVGELSRNKELISDLTQENNNLNEMLNIERENARNLGQELKTAQNTSEKSRDEASNLAKQLQQSRNLSSQLQAEVSKLQAEFTEARESLLRDIDEAKQGTAELTSAKELLSESNEKLQILTQEFAAALRKSDSLEKELVNAHEKAESATFDLKEEKKIVSFLSKELKALETQLFKDKEARRILETDLGETSKSLNEMTRAASMLSRELETANSRIPELEDEREALYKSIYEQKQSSEEARDNLEFANNLVMRLGNEKESLVKRGQKLEEGLASAKGEILRLRCQINASKASLNNDQKKQEVDSAGKVAVETKKVTRRRKVSSLKEDS